MKRILIATAAATALLAVPAIASAADGPDAATSRHSMGSANHAEMQADMTEIMGPEAYAEMQARMAEMMGPEAYAEMEAHMAGESGMMGRGMMGFGMGSDA